LVDVRRFLNDCLNMFKDLLTLKDVSVEKDLGGSDLCLLGNKFGLEQLFKNLILNAIDAMDGRAEKILGIKAKTENPSSLSIFVEDTGHGIPEESMDKIFTPYFTDKQQGTGLGLPVAKGIVENHRGRMQVRSEVGKGTTFEIRLDRHAKASEAGFKLKKQSERCAAKKV